MSPGAALQLLAHVLQLKRDDIIYHANVTIHDPFDSKSGARVNVELIDFDKLCEAIDKFGDSLRKETI